MLVFQTDDVRGLYETLMARGVTDFTQEPTDHFHGTDMGVRDRRAREESRELRTEERFLFCLARRIWRIKCPRRESNPRP